MKSHKKIKYLFLGGALLWAAGTCNALTLGKARGAVLLGQPLNLTIALQHEAGEASSDWCFDADVYYGDVRQERGGVTATPLRSNTGELGSVRVIAANPIDEPVVTVYLRSGCGLKTSRKYVLLSDLASDPVPLTNDIATGLLTSSIPKVQLLPGPLIRAEKNTTSPSRPVNLSKPVKTQSLKSATPAPIISSAIVYQRPRLKVSILDLLDVKNPNLRLSNELKTAPTGESQMRDDAKALWRSLNTSQNDILSADVQQRAFSANVQSLKEISAKNHAELQELALRVSKAESERFANPLTFALLGLLLASIFASLAMFTKLRAATGRNKPWWSGNDVADVADEDEDEFSGARRTFNVSNNFEVTGEESPVTATAFTKKPTITQSPGNLKSTGSTLELDLDLSSPLPLATPLAQHAVQSVVLANPKGRPAPVQPRDFSHSLHATLHAINTQEMLDVRQQADFFMTLGQHEEAISLLEISIRDSEASNPLVYLELLKVLHTLSRNPEFDHYRNEFNSIFTGWAPQYTVFGQPGNSLDAYPQICSEISQIWGSDSALEFLEQCMVRSPHDAPEHYFDLDAFRDLLLLHAVAGRIQMTSTTDSGFLPFSAMRTATDPKSLSLNSGSSKIVRPSEPIGSQLKSEAASVSLRTQDAKSDLIEFNASSLSKSLSLRQSK